jgi:hypothetical protein
MQEITTMKNPLYSFKLAALACVAMLAVTAARAGDFHVATSQDLQTALTTAAGNGSDNNIWLTNGLNGGYYAGTFSYNSPGGHSLTIQPEVGLTNTQITIDPAGGGRALNITSSNAPSGGSVSVSGITFLRNCGSYTIGSLRIASTTSGAILVDGCRFLSPTNNSQGMGLEIASGLNTTIRNCTVIGKTNGSANDGDGINIAGVVGTTLIYNCMSAGNYVGYGADITSSAILTVTNNVFQTNYYNGLYFYPSSSTKTAVVVVSNNVFSTSYNSYQGAVIENFGTLNMGANIFNGNRGGGAYIYYGGTATIAGNTFYGNGWYDGWWGGAYIGSLNMAIVTGNTFSGNTGGNDGGGVYLNNNTNILAGNTFNGNSMDDYGGAVEIGGGIITTISNNTFSANTAAYPGGAVASGSSGLVTITGNTFTGNSCSGNNQGGAVYVNSGTNIITANIFQQNSSADGAGAIYAACPAITISDNLVVNNTQTGASANGGGIFVNPGSILYMINNTIVGNSSAGGGGGAAFQIGTTPSLYVFNNIIWGNSATGNGADVYLTGSGQQTALQFNDVNGMYGVWNIAAPLLNTDPKFFNAVGGDYHLQPGSPCLNYGTNGASFLPLTDLDGNSRTNGAGQVDLGCYEFNITATHPADTNADFIISAAEYNAYAAAWKAGQIWTNGPNPGPNPIQANYVTRAGYLMTNNTGAYTNDGSARPTNWKVKQ